VLLYKHERKAVQEGRLPPDVARRLLRRRLWTLIGGVLFGYGVLWLAAQAAR
jgi:hypothetical protein